MLNRVDSHNWSVRNVINYLTAENDDVCFSDYARQHIARLISNGQDRTARNYELALGHLERYFGTTQVMFSQLTSTAVTLLIKSLESTHRAKEMYPVCMCQVFRAVARKDNHTHGKSKMLEVLANAEVIRGDVVVKKEVLDFALDGGSSKTSVVAQTAAEADFGIKHLARG